MQNIRYVCLVMSRRYIVNHFSDIKGYASVAEDRGEDEDCTMETVLSDNAEILRKCQDNEISYVYIDDKYQVDIEL